MKYPVITLLILAAVPGCVEQPAPPPAPSLSRSDAIAEVRVAYDRLVATWNSGDIDAVMALVADDFVQVQPETTIVGKEAIEVSWREHLSKHTDVWTPSVTNVQVVGDVGFVMGPFVEIATPKDGSEPWTTTGRGTIVFRRDAGGRWLQILDQWWSD